MDFLKSSGSGGGDVLELLSGAVEKLGAFVAPVVRRSPLETLKVEWARAKMEHTRLIDLEVSGHAISFRSLLSSLHVVCDILVEEDAAALARGAKEPVSVDFVVADLEPCLAFMLQDDNFKHLCVLGLANRPKGMTEVVLGVLEKLLLRLSHPVLPYKGFHQPLRHLIRVCQESCPEAEPAVVNLLHALWKCIRKEPSQLDFFCQEQQGEEIFKPILYYLMDFESPCADNARYAFLCMVDCDDERVTRYLLDKTTFIPELVAGFTQAYQTALAADDVVHLQKMLRLLNALTLDRAKLLRSTSPVPSDRLSKAHSEVSSESPFVERLVKAFRSQVVMKQIPDSLMETKEAKVEQAVKTIRVCLQTLTESQTPASVSPVLNDFLQLLVICKGSSQRTKLQEALILRVDSASAKLSISSMLLFQCLIEIGDQRVLESLLLSNLPMRKPISHSTPTKAIRRRLSADNDASSPGDEFLSPFKNSPKREKRSESGPVDSSDFESYFTDAQMDSAVQIVDYGSPSKATASGFMPSRTEVSSNEKASFLSQLFNKLEKFEDLTFDQRLAVTGLFSTLAKLPHEGLHERLFHPDDSGSSTRTLDIILRKLWAGMLHRMDEIEDFDVKKKARMEALELGQDTALDGSDGSELDFDLPFVDAVIVMEEFMKELASILDARGPLD